jgi:anaphase-promoting complex subunit 1
MNSIVMCAPDISLLQVMAGTGHVGTFKLLRYLRRRNDVDGAISYGNHTAVKSIN